MMDLRRHKRDGRHPPAPHLAAVTDAARQATRFDRRSISAAAGLRAAIPVVVVLAGGIAAGDPVAAVTMGAGAMLVGIAWRVGGGQPPIGLLATDALMMGASTFVGSVTGSVTWLHLVVLCLWSLMGGLLVGIGNRGGAVGTQAIIAVVVFGRFSEPVGQALGLAGLVAAGGFAQVVFQSLVRWPPPLRVQRSATAAAYRAVARLAGASPDTSTLPAAVAFDDAENTLSSLTLFGDPVLMTLRSLVNEGRRIRIELSAIHTLLRRHEPAVGDLSPGSPEAAESREVLERVLQPAATGLELAARAIEGGGQARATITRHMDEVSAGARAFTPVPGRTVERPLSRRLATLSGQLRAVGSLAASAGESGSLRARRPYRGVQRRSGLLATNLAQIRANFSRDSPVARHALRLAVIVPGTELLVRELPLQRDYWVVVAAAATLRPEFGATFTRGTERALGTCVGVGVAGLIAVGLHPAGGVTVIIVGLLAWAGYSVFPASFAAGFAFITAVVVFLLNAISPDTLATANARLVDTLIGGAIGLAAYALWPTWTQVPARGALAELVGAERTYLAAVLGAINEGRRAEESQMRDLARRARLARTKAEATVATSLSEPETRRIDAEQSQGVLAAMRRLVQATHVLRLDAQEERPRRPLSGLTPLARDLDALLSAGEAALRARPDEAPMPAPPPDLRASYSSFERAASPDPDGAGMLLELDEIVDAANSLAHLLGLDAAGVQEAAGVADPGGVL